MKSIKILCAGLAALSFVACNKHEVSIETMPSFKVVSSIDAHTRAPQLDQNGAGKFMEGDANTLFFQNDEKQHLKTFDYTYGSEYYWEDLKLPSALQQCQISACYPTVVAADAKNFDWDIQTHAAMPDFLFAAPVSAKVNTAAPVVLSFSHALHKLVVEMVPDGTTMTEEKMKPAEIEVRQFLPIATLDLMEAKSVGAKGELASMTEKSAKAAFIIPAQPVGQMEVVVKVGDRTASYPLSSCTVNGQALSELLSGQSFSLKIKVSQNAFTLVGSNISGWENQGEFEGNVTI